MDSIWLAVQGVLLLLIPAAGYLAYDIFKLWRARIKKLTDAEEEKSKIERNDAVNKALNNSAYIAVKAENQTNPEEKRDENGKLSAELAISKKENARQTLKKVLAPEILEMVRAQFGTDEKINEVIDPMIEAALHDVKSEKTTTTTTVQKTTVKEEGAGGEDGGTIIATEEEKKESTR